MKTRTTPYPPTLQRATIQKFLWEARFSLEIGKKGISKKDLAYIAGCWFRAIACLNQVMFALNETYWMNEKGAAAIADSFNLAPSEYSNRINQILTLVTDEQAVLQKSLRLLGDLIHETEQLVNRS
ncbi:hypothetical protein [Paenibacillus sp. HJGM_3]|uniref:hypothetical protein n=1 Tax=Paenibacillus sp. HJGM_3 TaxID=3379816 RepID=UPI00385E5FDE